MSVAVMATTSDTFIAGAPSPTYLTAITTTATRTAAAATITGVLWQPAADIGGADITIASATDAPLAGPSFPDRESAPVPICLRLATAAESCEVQGVRGAWAPGPPPILDVWTPFAICMKRICGSEFVACRAGLAVVARWPRTPGGATACARSLANAKSIASRIGEP